MSYIRREKTKLEITVVEDGYCVLFHNRARLEESKADIVIQDGGSRGTSGSICPSLRPGRPPLNMGSI
jgi:hypothetical protein